MNQADVIELYQFTRGPEAWRFTSADEDVEHDAQLYLPEAIRRSGDEQGQEIERADMEIDLPRGNPVANEFVAWAPDEIMRVTVFRRAGGITAVIWQGRVVNCEFQNNDVKLQCEPLFTSLQRAAVQARYQVGCRHVLYDDGCRVDRQDFRDAAALDSVSSFSVTSSAFAAREDGWYTGGYLQWGTVQRMILQHAGDTLLLSGPITGLQDGAEVDVFAGCDHTLETCDAKFDNHENYGGFPFIPDVNPFDGRTLTG